MVSSAVMGTGTVSSVSTKAVSRNNNTANGSDFKTVMAASIASGMSGTGVYSAGNKMDITASTKSSASVGQKNSQNLKQTEKKTEAGTTKSSDNNVDMNKLSDKINSATEDVKSAIKEELGVSDEDIAKAMEILGMSVNDLLSVVKVTELVGVLTDTDALSLITDDNMLNTLNSVLDVVKAAEQGIADMLGMGVEETAELISTARVQTSKESQAVSEDKKEDTFVNAESNAAQESLSDVLAKKITADGSQKNQAQTGGQNHNSDNYSGIADNMVQSITDSFADMITEDISYVSETDIVNQVIDQVKLTAGRELTSIEVMLNPERLGSVHVTVSAKNGILSAQIAAQNEQVKAALENQITALKEHFENQGIKVEAVEITVMTHQFEAGHNFGQSESERNQSERKSNKKLDLSAFEDDADEEISEDELRRKATINNGNSSVEYTA